MNISELPPEMMEKIFEYLTFRERILASHTCKLWHELIFCPKFCKRLFLYLRSSKDIVEKPYAREMLARCSNMVILPSNFEDHELSLLKDYMNGAPLELLRIRATKCVAKRIVETVLEVVPELKTLHLTVLGHTKKCADEVIRITHQKLEYAVLNGYGNYAVECRNLKVLESDQMNEEMIRSIRCLQDQLQILQLFGGYTSHHRAAMRAAYNVLTHYHWNRLRELKLSTSPTSTDNLETTHEHMPSLQKLSLHLHGSVHTFTGNEVGAATRLSELTLEKYRIDTDSFNKFLTRSALKRISLLNCLCWSVEVPLKSAYIKSLTLRPMYQNLLPLFPSLEELDLQSIGKTNVLHTLLQICEYYPDLERLILRQNGMMRPTPDSTNVTARNSFSPLTKLDKLKALHLHRIDLTGIDWTTCEGSNVEYIHLTGCSIEGTGSEKIVQSFKNLRKLYLDHCYLQQPRVTDGLRSLMRDCKISFNPSPFRRTGCRRDWGDLIPFS
nr:uncharacterized protein LOC109422265 [Aedes albopictus]